MDADTLELLRTSLGHVLTTDLDAPFGERLEELGWADVVADDPSAAVRALFEVKGVTRSAAPALDIVLSARAADLTGDTSLRGAAFALGRDLRAARLETNDAATAGVALTIDVMTVSPVGRDQRLLVGVAGDDGVRLATIPCTALDTTAISGMDPSLGLARITGTAAPSWIDTDGELAHRELIALAQRSLAAELVGLAQVMLADAVQYACDRRQYGRAIGSFQAVQHRLADARAAVTGAAVVTEEAFADNSSWTACVAKALAGRGFEEASRQAQQVYGAIGFTWEHEFHRSLRRGYVLDALFGDWRSLQEEIGRVLVATREVPRIGSL
jgi:hypothetical protein